MTGLFLLLILVVLFIILCVRIICIVPQANAWVIEFLGKYHSSWAAGLHLKVPFFFRIVKKVSLKEQVADFEPQPVITKDNVTMPSSSLTGLSVP